MEVNKIKIKWIKEIEHFKLLKASGNVGDLLDRHRVDRKAMILVKSGTIRYEEQGLEISLSAGEAHDIPMHVYHRVLCLSKAEFFVIMSPDTKMSFVSSAAQNG